MSLVFIVLFSGYLAISVNYSKAFNVKDKIVTIIEQNEGLNNNAQTEIDNYLSGVGYHVYGTCNSEEKGIGKSTNGNRYKYGVSKRTSEHSRSLKKT